MDEHERSYLVPVKHFADAATGKINWIEGNQLWVQMYPFDTWTHPIYSDTTIDKSVAEKMVQNFSEGVTGKKQIVEYDHGLDPVKGGKAAGEIIKEEVRDNGLFGLVQFNDIAKKEIDDGEWNYWSTTHYDEWKHPQTGEIHTFVGDGGSLTNKPYVRGMLPLNFSEVMIADPDLLVTKLDENFEKVITIDGVTVDTATQEWLREQLAAKTAKDLEDEGGEGTNMDEFEKQLREKLGLADDVDVMVYVTEINDEVVPLRELKKEHSDKKTFKDMYPEQAERLEALEAESRLSFAKNFSDAYATKRVVRKSGEGDDIKTETTKLGFSALVIEEIGTMAKDFSDGKASVEGFSKVIDTILDNGIVDYGSHGSSREDEPIEEPQKPKNFSDARAQFSELVDSIVTKDELDYDSAYIEAARRNPDLYTAYKEKKPVVTAAVAST